MNWKTTLLLLTLAGVLFAFIYLVERHTLSTSEGEPVPRLITLPAGKITAIQLRQTNSLFLRAERTNGEWRLTFPVHYPAQQYAIESLLQNIASIVGRTRIPMEELASRGQTIADFGLDVPLGAITLEHSEQGRIDIFLGSRTPVGDQAYLRLKTDSGIYVVGADLWDRFPTHANDWRDPALFGHIPQRLDRLEVRLPSGGFELRTDATNNRYMLTKPMVARTHTPRVDNMLKTILSVHVEEFVTDDPRAELERYGLQTPEAEIAFGIGSNDVVVVQFGKSPTNTPNLVYARRMVQTNIVLVPKDILTVLRVPPSELRDRRVLSFPMDAVKIIEVTGTENFSVHRQEDDSWVVSGIPAFTGDSELIRRFLERLTLLEGVVEKDLVTHFGTYGLEIPLRQYVLKGDQTNSSAGVTNRILDQLDLGARVDDKVFVRRGGETSVYAIARPDFDQLPWAPWQLRDRRVWTFAPSQVKSLTISHRGNSRRLVRNASGQWSLAAGSTGIVNSDAVHRVVEQLGQLTAEVWVDRGNQRKALYGFTDTGHKMVFEIENADKPQELVLEFGGFAKSEFPYAMATADGQSWIFEFPLHLFVELIRDVPPPRSNP